MQLLSNYVTLNRLLQSHLYLDAKSLFYSSHVEAKYLEKEWFNDGLDLQAQ